MSSVRNILVSIASWVAIGFIAVVVVVVGLAGPAGVPRPSQDEASQMRVSPVTVPPPLPPPVVEPLRLEPPPPLSDDPEGEIVEIPVTVTEALLADEDANDRLPAVGDDVLPELAPFDIPTAEIEWVTHRRDWVIHHVAPLERVEQIAYRYNVRSDALRMWNGLKPSTERLRPGSRVKVKPNRIPTPKMMIEYVVRPEDSWWSIATALGVDSRALRDYNPHSAARLRVGQKLVVWIDPVVLQSIATHDGDPDDEGYVRPGSVGIGPPQAGSLVNGVRIPHSPHYRLRLPLSSFGTSHAVEVFVDGIVRFKARTSYERPLILGSMSTPHGGPLEGHRSHQTGRDLDIRLPLKVDVPDWFPVAPQRIDWHVVWDLLSAYVETGEVTVIFLDYDLQKLVYDAAVEAGATAEERMAILQWPRGRKAHLGLVRHCAGHVGHVHIRFSCGEHEPECVVSRTDGV